MVHIRPTDSPLTAKLKSVVGKLNGGIEGHYPPEKFWSTNCIRAMHDTLYLGKQIIRTEEELLKRYSAEQIEALKTLGYLK